MTSNYTGTCQLCLDEVPEQELLYHEPDRTYACADCREQPPPEHFGPSAQRYRDDLIDDMAELYSTS